MGALSLKSIIKGETMKTAQEKRTKHNMREKAGRWRRQQQSRNNKRFDSQKSLKKGGRVTCEFYEKKKGKALQKKVLGKTRESRNFQGSSDKGKGR